MNRQGWIPVPLIASFPRVRRLTDNINDVREVLNMSSMVEVKEDMVRMKEWEHYLLPDEQSGHVDSINEFPQALSLTGSSAKVNRLVEEAVMKVIRDEGEGADTEEDEEEEEDVVFVMGQESGLWSPEAARS
ncbi:hypothetical protein GYMLUDRAFT_152062 [Collybiopsis luxurians FD-317 M1]|nr:hypothetical protein GYMLUDRAFT_152062 [Collybiopsis luxurians FD-317 M1]